MSFMIYNIPYAILVVNLPLGVNFKMIDPIKHYYEGESCSYAQHNFQWKHFIK